jgi:hypothetical protein
MFARVSETEPPVSWVALLLLIVRVTVEVPPDGIEAGLKPLLIVGALRTVRLAVLLAVPAVGVRVVVTPEVVLFRAPAVLLVTLKTTVQLPFAGMLMALKARLV